MWVGQLPEGSSVDISNKKTQSMPLHQMSTAKNLRLSTRGRNSRPSYNMHLLISHAENLQSSSILWLTLNTFATFWIPVKKFHKECRSHGAYALSLPWHRSSSISVIVDPHDNQYIGLGGHATTTNLELWQFLRSGGWFQACSPHVHIMPKQSRRWFRYH